MSLLNLSVPDAVSEMKNGIHSVSFARPKYFDIYKIFDCGQTFTLLPCDDGISGVIGSSFYKFVQNDDSVTVYGCTIDEYYGKIAPYLSLHVDYEAVNCDIASRFPKNGVIEDAMRVSDGIRILNQPLWETLCAFIISQNNNIPRIRKLIFAISDAYGDGIQCFDGVKRYRFPSADRLLECGVEGLRELKTGFRAAYLIDAAEKWQGGLLDGFDALDYESAKSRLLSIKGVGEKVANCVLLFAGKHYEAFPIDVWMKKVIDKYYGGELCVEELGKYAGIAQQYLFYYERYIISQVGKE